jgi:hypothetical protein
MVAEVYLDRRGCSAILPRDPGVVGFTVAGPPYLELDLVFATPWVTSHLDHFLDDELVEGIGRLSGIAPNGEYQLEANSAYVVTTPPLIFGVR